MTALERVEAAVVEMTQVAQRRALWEDEQLKLNIYRQVGDWMREQVAAEKAAAEAPTPEEVEAQRVKDTFASYRDKLKKEGRMR